MLGRFQPNKSSFDLLGFDDINQGNLLGQFQPNRSFFG